MRTRMYWYWILSLALFILAAGLLVWRMPAHPASAAPPTMSPIAMTPAASRQRYGVDEPFHIVLRWPSSPKALRAALMMSVATPVTVTGGPTAFTVAPKTAWPAHHTIRLTIDAAKLYPHHRLPRAMHASFTTDDDRTVVVNLTLQVLQAYRGRHLVRTMPIASGVPPRYTTPTGHFYIWRRVLSDRMRGGTPGQPGAYDVPHVPYSQYVYHSIAIHGAYWARQFGIPHSHGCIQLPTRRDNPHPAGVAEDAGWLWHFTHLGDPVLIRGTTPDHSRVVPYPTRRIRASP
jgi:lipoprotein-anchoring transpeptidase ErfK/SrfK